MMYARTISLGIVWLLCAPILGAQVVVHQLHHPVWLGEPFLRLGRLWFYPPHTYVVWYWNYAWYYPSPFEWGLAVMGVWVLCGVVLVNRLLKRQGWRRSRMPVDIDWARPRDIRKADLFARLRK
jgi:hypothetical protein